MLKYSKKEYGVFPSRRVPVAIGDPLGDYRIFFQIPSGMFNNIFLKYIQDYTLTVTNCWILKSLYGAVKKGLDLIDYRGYWKS